MNQQNEVHDLQTNLANLSSTVTSLQRDMGAIAQSNRTADARLQRIDEANNSIVEALNRNSADLRSFIYNRPWASMRQQR